MPDLLDGLTPWEPMLEFDTTNNKFRDELSKEPLRIQQQIKQNGFVTPPSAVGLGVEPDPDFVAHFTMES